ncbi:transposase family protein [Streptomyces sp. LN590]|uniref:transposase family protein n=1 Tax=Streptomyces sp. LN590 TaxID=3112980 RepID=UPI003712EC57
MPWASPALPGAVHDVRAAREHSIIDAPHRSRHQVLGRQGLSRRRRHGPHPCWGRWETLSTDQKAVNRSHAKIRALVEQAVATLKSWRLLRKLRCSTSRITTLVQAAFPLHLASSDR